MNDAVRPGQAASVESEPSLANSAAQPMGVTANAFSSSWTPKVSTLASQNESLPRKVYRMAERSRCFRGCSQPKSFPRSSMKSHTYVAQRFMWRPPQDAHKDGSITADKRHIIVE
jgi:hypothetical protein